MQLYDLTHAIDALENDIDEVRLSSLWFSSLFDRLTDLSAGADRLASQHVGPP